MEFRTVDTLPLVERVLRHLVDEEFLWIETDKNGDAVPGTDTNERITSWLNKQINDDYDLLEHWGQRTSTQYAPGFALMSSFSKKEIDVLKIWIGDLGGRVICVMRGFLG
jgi:hypothetical protein